MLAHTVKRLGFKTHSAKAAAVVQMVRAQQMENSELSELEQDLGRRTVKQLKKTYAKMNKALSHQPESSKANIQEERELIHLVGLRPSFVEDLRFVERIAFHAGSDMKEVEKFVWETAELLFQETYERKLMLEVNLAEQQRGAFVYEGTVAKLELGHLLEIHEKMESRRGNIKLMMQMATDYLWRVERRSQMMEEEGAYFQQLFRRRNGGIVTTDRKTTMWIGSHV